MIDSGFIASMLKETGGVKFAIDSGINKDFFSGNFSQVYDVIVKHYSSYGKAPDISTIEGLMGSKIEDTKEPLSYWLKEVQNRYIYEQITGGFNSVVQALEHKDGFKALEHLDGLLHRAYRGSGGSVGKVENLIELGDEVISLYDRAKQGLTGIKTPWDALDLITMGWQPEELVIFASRSGLGKCHKNGTPILMFDGSIKKVEDIVVGDLVMGPDSKPRTVLSLCRGRDEMFDVIPVKGERWGCNRSHILSLRNGSKEIVDGYGKGDICNISVDEYLKKGVKFKQVMKLWRTGIDFEERQIPFDPYVLGVWLGDGTRANTEITNPESEIIEYLREWCNSNGFYLNKIKDKDVDKCGKYSVVMEIENSPNPFRRYLKSDCIIENEKRIPREYLINCREKRLQLLAGLIDTDGYLAGGCYEIITKYTGLKDDILFLARSLGFAAYAKEKVSTIMDRDFSGVYWRIYIHGDIRDVPVKVERKKANKRKQIKNVLNVGFKLESKGEGDYYGFNLDGDHLYLLGDFTVTHNSWMLLIIAYHAMMEKKKVLLVCTEMSRKAVARRFFSVSTRMSYGHVRHGKLSFTQEPLFKRRIAEMMSGELKDYIKIVGDGFDFSVDALEAAVIEEDPDMVLIDGAYLLKVKGVKANDRFAQVSSLADELKKMAKKYKKPIIASVQLNRKAAGDSSKEKIEVGLQHLGLSDNLGWVSDYVFLLTQDTDDKQSKVIRLKSAKTRDSDNPGDIPLRWDFESMCFDELKSGVDYDRIRNVKKAKEKKEKKDSDAKGRHWTESTYDRDDQDTDFEQVPF
jgi:replicative DNA helicase